MSVGKLRGECANCSVEIIFDVKEYCVRNFEGDDMSLLTGYYASLGYDDWKGVLSQIGFIDGKLHCFTCKTAHKRLKEKAKKEADKVYKEIMEG